MEKRFIIVKIYTYCGTLFLHLCSKPGLFAISLNGKIAAPALHNVSIYRARNKLPLAFASCAKQMKDFSPATLTRRNASLHHQARLKHALDRTRRRLIDLAKHHVDGMLGKHGHVLLD